MRRRAPAAVRFAQARHAKLVRTGAFGTERNAQINRNPCQTCGNPRVLEKTEKGFDKPYTLVCHVCEPPVT